MREVTVHCNDCVIVLTWSRYQLGITSRENQYQTSQYPEKSLHGGIAFNNLIMLEISKNIDLSNWPTHTASTIHICISQRWGFFLFDTDTEIIIKKSIFYSFGFFFVIWFWTINVWKKRSWNYFSVFKHYELKNVFIQR